MSRTELSRLRVMIDLADGRTRVEDAAALMGLQRRQVYPLLDAFRAHGPDALICKRRGKPSNRAHGAAFRQTCLAIVRERYEDFGPTLAAEKLADIHGLPIGVETLRQWMIDDGIWVRRRDRIKRVLPRKKVTVYDFPDGRIEVRHQGLALPYRTFDRITLVDQGAIVENKRLSEALEMCRAMQAELPPKLRSRKAPARTAQNGHMFSA